MRDNSANLDALRAAAVITVLIDHFIPTVACRGVAVPPEAQRFFEHIGHAGVLAFFVHTRLVLMYSLERLAASRAHLSVIAYGFSVLAQLYMFFDQVKFELNVNDRIPFRPYAGYEDSGTRFTGEDRFLAGFNWGNVFGLDQQLNYQYATDAKFDLVQANLVELDCFESCDSC